jgi:hypothetical protein
MMSSTVWARRVLSPATQHSIIGAVLCHCVTRPVAVADRCPTMLTPGCSHPVAQVVEPLSTMIGHCDLPATRLVCI